jgi:hypothetical protein
VGISPTPAVRERRGKREEAERKGREKVAAIQLKKKKGEVRK